MKTVYVTRGLSGSGKTTWAKEKLVANPGACKIVCKDDLRAMLDNGKHSKGNEAFVLKVRDILILEALREGKHVIVADTNLNPIHYEHIEKLVQDAYQADEKIGPVQIVVQDFTDVPIEQCIANDLKRCNPVGEKVIRTQWKQWLRPKPAASPDYVPGAPSAIIVDLDGTLALHHGRNPFDYSKLMEDWLNAPIYNLIMDKVMAVHMLTGSVIKILLVSGRDSVARSDTESWLRLNHVKYDQLWMRPERDMRKDVIVKDEIYRREIEGKYNIACVFDDRNQVVEYWRSLGLTCLQVQDGDF